jgi:predicted transcriptional regulator of viral defense system
MSTRCINTTNNRFAKLAQMGEIVFHTDDLANIWQIKNKNTLHTTLKRYTQKGLLFRIYKGFYSLRKVEDLNPAFLGIKALNKFAYLSTESVLVQHGIITQISNQITLISSVSKKYKIKNNSYKVRQLSDKFLFNKAGIILAEGYYRATPERAVADLLYFNPNFHFDGEKLIDWKKVKEIQKELGREFVKLKA